MLEPSERYLANLLQIDPTITTFLTGSRAYGKPRPDSDYDIVVYCPDIDVEAAIRSIVGYKKCVLGKVNYILCPTYTQFVGWMVGTQYLMRHAPVTKEYAIAVFDELGTGRTYTTEDVAITHSTAPLVLTPTFFPNGKFYVTKGKSIQTQTILTKYNISYPALQAPTKTLIQSVLQQLKAKGGATQ